MQEKRCITISIRGLQEMVEHRLHFELSRNEIENDPEGTKISNHARHSNQLFFSNFTTRAFKFRLRFKSRMWYRIIWLKMESGFLFVIIKKYTFFLWCYWNMCLVTHHKYNSYPLLFYIICTPSLHLEWFVNGFNPIYRPAALWNAHVLWIRCSRFLFNSYQGFALWMVRDASSLF